jgi:DNA-binding MarR family transcriptional regulator
VFEPEYHLITISSHERGLKGYLEDLEYSILHAVIMNTETMEEGARLLKIKRSTFSMKILSFMKRGYLFKKAYTLRRHRRIPRGS